MGMRLETPHGNEARDHMGMRLETPHGNEARDHMHICVLDINLMEPFLGDIQP